MIKRLIDYFGFIPDVPINATYPASFDAKDNLASKLDYLKTLDSQENSRQSTIESKTSQLIGQTGIIFTLLGLFIANYLSKFSSWPVIFQIALITFFLVCFFFYLCTIFQATKYLNVAQYTYGQRDVSTVKKSYKSNEDFQVEEIKDVIYSIERNTQVNNLKCNNLMYAYRSFRVGTIMGGLLSVLLIFSTFFSSKNDPIRMQVQNSIHIQGLDSAFNDLEKEIRQIKLIPVVLKDTCISK